MSDQNRYGGAHLLLAFVAGAAAGAAVALLTAPKSGRETREQLRGMASQVGEKAGHLPEAIRSAYGRAAEAARDAFHRSLKDESPGDESA